MTATEILKEVGLLIKSKFTEQAPPVPSPAEPIKMIDVTLKDGTVATVDKLEVGGLVKINDAPAPDGEHLLEDGKTIQTVGGAIVEISSPQEDLIPEEMKKIPAQVQAMAAQFASVEKGYKAKFEAQENKIASLKEATEKMHEALVLMSEQSVTKPKEDPELVAGSENFKEVLKNRGKI